MRAEESTASPREVVRWPRIVGLRLRNFRNYECGDVDVSSGVTVVHGPVGAGKTNLLEAMYFACVGKSPRTANDRELIRFGERTAHVSATASSGELWRTFEAGLELGRPKTLRVDGARVERSPLRDMRPLLCVFMPDRLGLVKGPAAVRRSHLDALVSALWPARHQTRLSYARALAQRNALLGRVRAGAAGRSSLSGWSRELARHGLELMAHRQSAIELLSQSFRDHVSELGIESPAALRYRPGSHASSIEQLEAELASALDRDVERAFTTRGPHRDDLMLAAGDRDLRRFGSQGQQRLALLALLLAERDALERVRGELPIFLLDDVLSELDRDRRVRLLAVLRERGQTLITTADPEAASAVANGFASVCVADGRIDA